MASLLCLRELSTVLFFLFQLQTLARNYMTKASKSYLYIINIYIGKKKLVERNGTNELR